MTNPSAAEQVSSLEEETLAAHLAAIAEMHATAVAHIASIAAPWLRSATSPHSTAQATGQLAAQMRPPVPTGDGAAA